ncbi:histone-like nucleoid-structuring protein Lsr2 [Rhodococcus sp. NCIMB 12038]|uniref:Lsr2 family DNA-binding protein n=1 Tax=Rhodococcus sp. NCIMB 12038 TaxID=933800 RepID=UPI000B3C6F1F|nr:histone-like nucleoid-structuring protein Lsr2 [Rhodococcus sp. NCIMB 12038]OUS97183.1 hypothetical protein CA951_04170 [Rhodococcus sp. NCIMB 12038]
MAQSPTGSKDSAKTTREIREWAIGAGLDVSSRGRIPAEVVKAFEDAQVEKVQTKTAPAKTTKEIREWAVGAGLDVSPRGRIPAEIVQAFEDAQLKQSQPKRVPVKKLAARKPVVKKPVVKKVAVKKVATEKPAAKNAPVAKTTSEIREWAVGAGLDVSSRGRISAEIVKAFEDAQTKQSQPKKRQAKKVEATTVPAKKVAAEKPAVTKVVAEKPAAKNAPATKTTKEIREWAIGAGLDVSARGRISAEVERAFHDAQVKKVQAKKVQTKAVRAKKVAAGKPAVKKVAAKKTAATKAPSNRAAVSKAPAKRTTREIREWAIGEGLDISARGRISAEIVDAFNLAQAKAPAA